MSSSYEESDDGEQPRKRRKVSESRAHQPSSAVYGTTKPKGVADTARTRKQDLMQTAYVARRKGDMYRFLNYIHFEDPAHASRIHTLVFKQYFDIVSSSRILHFLGIDPDNVDDPENPPKSLIDHAAAEFRFALGLYGEKDEIPLDDVMEVYGRLFSICNSVTTITIPKSWFNAKGFCIRRWARKWFPLVKRSIARHSDDGTMVTIGSRRTQSHS